MLSRMSLAVVWGWYGVGGAVSMLALALFALWAMFANLEEASAGQPFLTRLMGSGRAALALLFAVLLLFGGSASFWGAFHEQRIQFTVQTLREEHGDGDTSYEVDDTEDRTFVANPDDWQKLREGDDVECRVATPPLLPGRLLSCRQQPR
ncbi:MAG: hypothetical protein LC790_12025 [Actinobacteria bacterium]|nr:hypothetical protein [Actinomycetota bacterium]MCA1699575.1 hypothetical protein [Actinomycetota bacterium]